MNKRFPLFTISFLLILVISSGCSQSSSPKSYAAIVNIQDKQYIWTGNLNANQYSLGEKIDVIETKVEADKQPDDHLESNFLDPGVEIYYSKEDPHVVIAKNKDGLLKLFTEMK